MKILLLGGTVFLGRQIVQSALRRNHEVTLFNRGIRNPGLFPDLENLTGDRAGDLSALSGRNFDAVIDTSGQVPVHVANSAAMLKDNASHYTFISSISVYGDFAERGLNEMSATVEPADLSENELNIERYGPMKLRCENEVSRIFGSRALNIRPGLIVGDNDWTDRFTYWIHRISEGGEFLIPDTKDFFVQFIDVRDLADWIVKMSEEKQTGIFNATGPEKPMTFESFIDSCMMYAGNDAVPVRVSSGFLEAEQVSGWSDLPMWVPKEMEGIGCVDISKALGCGLTFRTLEDTLSDTIKFDRTRAKDYKFRSGLSREREAELIAKWKKLAGN